jgi:hypothetical protein
MHKDTTTGATIPVPELPSGRGSATGAPAAAPPPRPGRSGDWTGSVGDHGVAVAGQVELDEEEFGRWRAEADVRQAAEDARDVLDFVDRAWEALRG